MKPVIVRLLCLWGLLVLLTGCPTPYQQLESDYFSDQFSKAAIGASQLPDDETNRALLADFFKRNHRLFVPELRQHCQLLSESPSPDSVDTLKQTVTAISHLQTQFPQYIPEILVQSCQRSYDNALLTFSSNSQLGVEFLLSRHRYRQALETLESLQKRQPLSSDKKALMARLSTSIHRQLSIEPIKVHDQRINSLLKTKHQPVQYNSASSTLLEKNINIPEKFSRDLRHFFNKDSSNYFSLINADSSHYRLVCLVGFHKNLALLEERKQVSDTFYVQQHQTGPWTPTDVLYETFSKTDVYHVSVSAELFLGDRSIGRYIFETLANNEQVRTGDILTVLPEATYIEYSTAYTQLQSPPNPLSETTMIQRAIEDAAQVLAVKVLNTVDTDPDPYSAAFPLL